MTWRAISARPAAEGIPNAKFQVMDALAMEFPENSFDLVWACESGEHMPDKAGPD
jgi:MPBQ/MSBQ methyltransferase